TCALPISRKGSSRRWPWSGCEAGEDARALSCRNDTSLTGPCLTTCSTPVGADIAFHQQDDPHRHAASVGKTHDGRYLRTRRGMTEECREGGLHSMGMSRTGERTGHRRRLLAFWLAIALLFLPAGVSVASAQSGESVEWAEYNVELAVNEDGTIHVTETQVVEFDGRFRTGFADIPTDQIEEL